LGEPQQPELVSSTHRSSLAAVEREAAVVPTSGCHTQLALANFI